MKFKNDANNSFADSIEITEVERFLKKKRTEGYPGMGMLHVCLASYVRVISQKPALNRFIAGQRIYARNGIEVIMIVKKTMSIETAETSIKVRFEPTDTISDIYNKINAEVEKIKNGADTDTDDVAKTLMKIPRVILKFLIFFLNMLEYFGKLPQMLVDVSPFHGSLFVTDLGSIGIPPVYHHLYNFGTIPLFLALGRSVARLRCNRMERSPRKNTWITRWFWTSVSATGLFRAGIQVLKELYTASAAARCPARNGRRGRRLISPPAQ